MRLRALQPSMFGIAALCFLLPFVELSCGPEATFEGALPEVEEARTARIEARGYELVLGKPLATDVEDVAEGFRLDPSIFRIVPEPFAVVALGASLAGLGSSLLASPGRRALCGIICGVTGAGALVLLAVAPVTRAFGAIRFSWQVGYALCLLAFVAASAAAIAARAGASGAHSPRGPAPPPVPPGPPRSPPDAPGGGSRRT